MKYLMILFAALLLTGCPGPTPIIIKEPVEVRIPVPVPCVKAMPEKPVFELDKPEVKAGTLFEKGNGSLREIEQRRAYAGEMEVLLKACLGTPTPLQK